MCIGSLNCLICLLQCRNSGYKVVHVTIGCCGRTHILSIRLCACIPHQQENGEEPAEVIGNVMVNNIHFVYPSRPDVVIFRCVRVCGTLSVLSALLWPVSCVGDAQHVYRQVIGNVRVNIIHFICPSCPDVVIFGVYAGV